MKILIGQAAQKGRGVFAGERIACGQTVEICPVIVFSKAEWRHIEQTDINQHCYYWGEKLEDGALVLGYGSLYNHSYQPNAKYVRHMDTQTMEYIAVRDILEGEEITINYNGGSDASSLWFDVV